MTAVSQKRFYLPILVIFILALFGGWYWYANMCNYIATDDAIVEGNQSTISAKILGKITNLNVNEGENVKTGQLLVQLDDSDLRAQEKQSEAALAYAQQNVSLAEINLNKAQDDFVRADGQFKGGYLSKEQHDHTQSALESAKAQYSIAQAQVNNNRAQLGVVETQLKNTTIISSINGVVSKRWVFPGDVVQPGQSILSVFDIKNVWVTANFEETKLAQLRINEPVEISVDAYPNDRFSGKIVKIGSATAAQFSLIPPNNASGNFTKITQRIPVKIAVLHSPSSKPLLPGISVEVKVKVN